jgi:catechol 2,3-dioxygenase-like lactoylglutathione lyase family enzyme
MMIAIKPSQARTLDMKLEVIVIPVSNVDRAKQFYGSLGWRLDADFAFDDGFRVIQFTPPGSGASVIFGTNVTAAAPGSAKGLYLVVSDIEAARKEPTSPICSAVSGSAARTPHAAATSLWPRSAIRTATAGCSRKLPRGFPVVWRPTRPLPRQQISRPRCGAPQRRMASMRNEQASMMWAGRTGTPSTSSASRRASHCHPEPATGSSVICCGLSVADQPQAGRI